MVTKMGTVRLGKDWNFPREEFEIQSINSYNVRTGGAQKTTSCLDPPSELCVTLEFDARLIGVLGSNMLGTFQVRHS